MKVRYFLLLILLFFVSNVFSKTKKFGTWVEMEFSKEFLKKWEFSIIPELRFQDDFSLDEYIFEGKLGYEPFKFLELAAAYRLNTNVKKSGNETSQRAAFDIAGSTKFNRFDGSLRARFTNDADDEDVSWETFNFRPRIKLQYNIKGNKIEPFANYELFHDLKMNDVYKGRFDIGFTRKIGDFHRVGLYYRLQDYFNERSSIHILGIDYRFKF